MSRTNPKQAKQKAALIEQLKKIPIVHIAVEKAGVSRAAYYVWKKQDQAFAKAVDEAISEGVLFINDLSESQLISLIKDKDMQSIRFWLTHRHPSYAAKLKVQLGEDEIMSAEQLRFVNKAIKKLDFLDKKV